MDRAGCTYVMPSYSEPIAQHLFTFGAYEPETQHVILEFLPERGTLIDVGANIGALAIPIARLRPRSHIVALRLIQRFIGCCRLMWTETAARGFKLPVA